MAVFITILVILVIAMLVFRRQRKPVHARYARSRLITGRNTGTSRRPAKQMLPVMICPDCGKPETVCRRKTADAGHAEEMLGYKRKQ